MPAIMYPEGAWCGLVKSDGARRVLRYYTPPVDARMASRGRLMVTMPTAKIVQIARTLVSELPTGIPARLALDDVLSQQHPVRISVVAAVWDALVVLGRVQM